MKLKQKNDCKRKGQEPPDLFVLTNPLNSKTQNQGK